MSRRAAAAAAEPVPVILLHGLWLRRPALWPLAHRLRAAGFAPRLFPYATLFSAPERSVERLAQWVRALPPGPVHLLGHSLGGVTVLAMLAAHPELAVGRVLCLGSPLNGSASAARLRALRLGWLVGRSGPLLARGVAALPGREIGVIAGTRPAGAGRLLGSLHGANDGTVSVEETRLGGISDHLLLPVSHTGLLFDRRVAAACIGFLRDGRFPAAAGSVG